MFSFQKRLLRLLSVGLLISLTACGSIRELSTHDRQTLDRHVQALVSEGQYQAAAQVYLDKATEAEGPLAVDLRLDAGKVLLEGGLSDRALEVIGPDPMAEGSPNQRSTAQVMLARYFESQGDLNTALRVLGEPVVGAGVAERTRILRLQGRYHQSLGALDRAVLARSRVLALLDAQQRQEETQAIWQWILQAEETQRRSLQQHRQTRLWADMLAITRAHALDPESLERAMIGWRRQYDDHAAAQPLAALVQRRFRAGGIPPSRIAVLLPLSGRLADAGGAVRDGILAAYFRLPPQARPHLDFHDTAAVPVNHLYAQALADGAQALIGPLRKEALKQIAAAGEPPIPVLSSNQDPSIGQPHPNLYQFGLSPEDEAREVGEYLFKQGHLRTLVFTPQGDWGKRVGRQFLDTYSSLGGTALAIHRFDPRQKDFSATLQSELGLDDSKARSRDLNGLLGMSLEFEPRRRRDVQAIFLAAPNRQARLIKPQLKFHRAGDVPVFATSRVYPGRRNAEADRDLDGLSFPDAPWVIGDGAMAAQRSRMEADLPHQNPNYVRFHALGFDALNLLPKVRALRLAAGQGIAGATGELYCDAGGRIHRKLLWARFDNGIPRLLTETTPTEVESTQVGGIVTPTSTSPAQP